MSFYMILPSNGCPNTQLENKASSYIIDWELPINLKGKWEVALTEISFNHSTILHKAATNISYAKRILKKYSIRTENNKYYINDVLGKYKDDCVTIGFTDQINDFIFEIKQKLAVVTFENLEDAQELGFTGLKTAITNYLYDGERTVLDLGLLRTINFEVEFVDINSSEAVAKDENKEIATLENVVAYYTKHFSNLFEVFKADSSNVIMFSLKKDIAYVIFSALPIRELGFFKNTVFYNQNGKMHRADEKPNIKITSQQFYIYSSVVDQMLVGGVRVPLLRSIWINASSYSSGDVVNESMDNLMYLPVSSTSINNIEVQIRNDAGQLINFPYGSKSSITLHFKEIQ